MMKNVMVRVFYTSLMLFFTTAPAVCKIVVFYEPGFPSVDNGAISKQSLERAFGNMGAQFAGIDDLKQYLSDGDLLILPYGSAFPANDWDVIKNHLSHGNILIVGGKPLCVPVYRDGSSWRLGSPQNSYSKILGIMYSYEASQTGPWKLKWDADAPYFRENTLNPLRVFVNAGFGWKYRGLGYMENEAGDRLAAPIVADDAIRPGLAPQRGVFMSFDADSTYWSSESGLKLMNQAAGYASLGGCRIWINLQQLSLKPGDRVEGAVDVTRAGDPAVLTLELMRGGKVVESRSTVCGNSFHERLGLDSPVKGPGLYVVRATLSRGDTLLERYTTGVEVRDQKLLDSGPRLAAGRDYFTLGGAPYLMAGTNYFSTDPNTSDFFVGGSLGGNAYVWERDFSEMERHGLTIVRTGNWMNRVRYVDDVTGGADERFLDAVEAYLEAAARHHFQVIFTLFAFDPQIEMQQGHGQEGDLLAAGSNPYLDPVTVASEISWVRSIASRFKDVSFLTYDLINEPSYSNPKLIWKGNSPNGDPDELASWHSWLKKRYDSLSVLSRDWRIPSDEYGSFDDIPLPSTSDLQLTRYGNANTVRAGDYNLFAQDAFIQWADTIIQAIRQAGSDQIVTIGQDEGGVADRVLAQFWASSDVSFTVNHTWWRDDALLWSSMASKSLIKPNVIGETGAQPVWDMDGTWRWDDAGGTGLLERKLALGFAAGNSGVLQWDWSRSDDFGLLRRDGSYKAWMDVMSGIAKFAHNAEPFAKETIRPDIAVVLPQSLQLSVFGKYSIEVQQNCIRALYQYARGSAYVVGEDQASEMPDSKLIIVPAPWILSQAAWNVLIGRVKMGATLLISGRIDADEHWLSVESRTAEWHVGYRFEDLTAREALVDWPGDSARLSFPDDITTYCQRGIMDHGKTFADVKIGMGRVLYFALPLELSGQLDAVGRIYMYAMRLSGAHPSYETNCPDPGILICPTQLPQATLYVLTSESASTSPFQFTDSASGKSFAVTLPPGRAALLLVGKSGNIIASYNSEFVVK